MSKSRIDPSIKIRVVEEYVDGKINLVTTAKKAEVTMEAVRY
jgi:hypothetical protein